MRKGIYICIFAGLVAVFSFVLASTADAAALTNASVTPTTFYGGRLADYSVSFEVASSAEIEAQIHLVFPSGFTVPSSVATSSITSSLTLAAGTVASATVVSADNTIVLWLADGAVAVDNDTLHFSGIPAIKHPYTGGSKQVGIMTRTQAAEDSDEASSTAFSIIDAPTELPKQTPTTTVGPPSSKITSPKVGQVSAVGENLIIQGTAVDFGLYDVSKVEVSVDSGITWVQADLTEGSDGDFTWEYVWKIPGTGTYNIKSRATDAGGNVESPGKAVVLDISSAAPAVSPTPTPAAEATTIQSLQLRVVSLQQQVVALLQQLLSLLQSRL